MSTFYFFGCYGIRGKDSAGHYMRSNPKAYSHEDRHRVHELLYSNPWGTAIDSGLCIQNAGEQEGLAVLRHKAGWTVLSYWDRSGPDIRPGCNSNFLIQGTYNFEEMLALAKGNFPEVLERLGRQILLSYEVNE